MHSIKVFVISVIIMMGFLAIVTLFLPSKVTVSKSILINATEAEVTKEIGAFKNWGKVIRLAKGGIVLSFFARPLTIKPKPINTINPIKLKTSISIKVSKP